MENINDKWLELLELVISIRGTLIFSTIIVIFEHMKYFFFVLLMVLSLNSSAQSLFAYMDFNNFFRVYKNGYAVQIDHQAINNLALGDNICLYKNFQNDLKMYDGKTAKVLTAQNTNYIVSDNIGAWNIGSLL